MPQGAEHTAAGTHPGPSCQASPKHPNPSLPPVMVAKHKTIPLDTLTTFRASNSVAFTPSLQCAATTSARFQDVLIAPRRDAVPAGSHPAGDGSSAFSPPPRAS